MDWKLFVLVVAVVAEGRSEDICSRESLCSSCLEEGCWYCINEETEACVLEQMTCPNGSFIIIPPFSSPEFCPRSTTTTTTPSTRSSTSPPSSTTQSPFYFWFFIIIMVVFSLLGIIAFVGWVYYKKLDGFYVAPHVPLGENDEDLEAGDGGEMNLGNGGGDLVDESLYEDAEEGEEDLENLQRLSEAVSRGQVESSRGVGYYSNHQSLEENSGGDSRPEFVRREHFSDDGQENLHGAPPTET